MKLVLHIGTPKTGTTALQAGLARERGALAAAEVCYPALTGRSGHALLSLTLGTGPVANRILRQHYDGAWPRAARDLEAAWSEVEAAAAAGPRVMILSSEYFFARLNDASAPALRARLARLSADLHIIAYIRRPSEYFLSLAQQHLKRASTIPDPAGIDLAGALDRWERHFPGRVEAVRFERGALRGADILNDFLSRAVPGGAPGIAPAPVINESLSAEAMSVMQDYQRRWCPGRDDIQTKGKRALLRLVQAFDAADPATRKPRLRAGLGPRLDARMGDPEILARRWGLDFAGPPPQPGPAPRLVDVADLCEIDTARLARMRASVHRPWGADLRLRRRVVAEKLHARLLWAGCGVSPARG